MSDYLIETRTAAEIDDLCGMQYWWNSEESGTGIVPLEAAEALQVGAEIHEDLAMVAALPDDHLTVDHLHDITNDILATKDLHDTTTEKLEVLYRRLGWLTAFALFMEPRIRETYETVQVEHDITLDRNPLLVPITPDRVLRHRQDKYLVYREYKSALTASQKWIQSWPFAIQIHLGIKAIEEELGEKVAFGQVMGLLKGDRRDYLSHPFVYGYRRSDGKWSPDYQRGDTWERLPVWEYPGGLVGWIELVGEDRCKEIFPHSYPVFLNERMLDDWITRRTARQAQIEEVREVCQYDWNERIIYFEPRSRACKPAYGDPCPFLRACWNAEINQNPLASGLFKRRVPHHELELIGVQ